MNTREWIKALFMAVWWLARRADWRVFFARAWGMLLLLIPIAIRSSRLNPQLRDKRTAECEKCPMFVSAHKTCGQPGEVFPDPETNRLVPLGCWCYLPAANLIPEKDCWARAHGLSHGWPDELRPYGKVSEEAGRN